MSTLKMIGLGVLALGLASCTAPRKISVAELGSEEQVAARAHDFWDVNDPVVSGADSPRIAITEFSLEYETTAGVSKGIQIELPGLLYRSFVETISEFGAGAVPLKTVSASEAYQGLAGASMADVEIAPAGDAKGIWHPVDGLLVLEDDQAAGIAKVLEETKADMALQVRFRVGLDNGRAVIRTGSTLHSYTADDDGYLVSKRDLVSVDKVVDDFEGEIAVDSRRLVTQSQELFRRYIMMALVAAGIR